MDLVFINNGEIVTDSLTVAEVFEKRHGDIIRSIETLTCSKDFSERNFASAEYKDAQSKLRKKYFINRDGLVFLIMGFTGEKAAGFKEQYIKAFNDMEQKLKGAAEQKQFDTSQLSPELQMFQKIFNSVAQQQLEQKRLAAKVEQTERKVDSISEIVALNSTDWRKDTTAILNKIALKTGGFDQYRNIRNESYELLEQRASAKLNIRVANKQKKMALEGITKSKINKVTKLDAIEDDKRLLEIYLAVVKEMAIKYKVDYSPAV